MLPPFNEENTHFAYQIRFHFGFATHRCQPIFHPATDSSPLRAIADQVCQTSKFHLLEFDVEPTVMRLLASLTPHDCPSRFVQTLKANISRRWNEQRPDALPKLQWSRGYFFRSVGNVTTETVAQYIASQRDHHVDSARLIAEYNNPRRDQLEYGRTFTHSIGQYTLHIVFCPVKHVPALDPGIGAPLLAHIQSIASKCGFDLLRVAILEDHVHALVTLPPTFSPAFVVLALMNNTSHWFHFNNPGMFKVWDVPGVWSPSAYVGTVGDVTSQHIRNYLQNVKD